MIGARTDVVGSLVRARELGEICETQEPPLAEVEPEHFMRCHIPIEELRALQRTQPKERAPVP